jgi:hypothetical protein
MQEATLSREPVGNEEGRPAASLVEAMAAVLEGEPDRPILLAEKVYVRACYLVSMLAPEALERATAHQSICSGAVERVSEYTA